MARLLKGPGKNTNRLRGKDHSRLVDEICPRSVRLLTLRSAAISGLFALALLFGTSGPMAASQDERPIATAKIDWGIFLPEGDGKAEVSLACSSCHDLRQVITQKKPGANWNATVRKMISAYQAPVDKDDVQIVVDYLSKNFGDQNPIEHLPMNINTSPIEALARLPGINIEAAKAIVASRKTAGSFASIQDLLRVKCIDSAILKRIEAYISTKD
jgi:competence ComEA-like helix-hairpin-helix protein